VLPFTPVDRSGWSPPPPRCSAAAAVTRPEADAIGGTSVEAHRTGLDRVIQAGGQPISWVSLAGELLRDWARPEAAAIAEIVVTDRLAKEQ